MPKNIQYPNRGSIYEYVYIKSDIGGTWKKWDHTRENTPIPATANVRNLLDTCGISISFRQIIYADVRSTFLRLIGIIYYYMDNLKIYCINSFQILLNCN